MTILEERLIEEISGILHNYPKERDPCIKAIKDRFVQLGDTNYEELCENIQHDMESNLDKIPSRLLNKCLEKIGNKFRDIRFLKVFNKLTLTSNTQGYHGYLTLDEVRLLFNMGAVKYTRCLLSEYNTEPKWFYFISTKPLHKYIA